MKNHLVILSILISIFSRAQQSDEIFTVDVYIDSNAQVYLENMLVEPDQIEEEMSDYVYKNNAFYEDEVLYRIYADRNLKLDIIMNVNNQLIKAFHPSRTRTERYLLNAEELDVNASSWQMTIKKLNLKAVEN